MSLYLLLFTQVFNYSGLVTNAKPCLFKKADLTLAVFPFIVR